MSGGAGRESEAQPSAMTASTDSTEGIMGSGSLDGGAQEPQVQRKGSLSQPEGIIMSTGGSVNATNANRAALPPLRTNLPSPHFIASPSTSSAVGGEGNSAKQEQVYRSPVPTNPSYFSIQSQQQQLRQPSPSILQNGQNSILSPSSVSASTPTAPTPATPSGILLNKIASPPTPAPAVPAVPAAGSGGGGGGAKELKAQEPTSGMISPLQLAGLGLSSEAEPSENGISYSSGGRVGGIDREGDSLQRLKQGGGGSESHRDMTSGGGGDTLSASLASFSLQQQQNQQQDEAAITEQDKNGSGSPFPAGALDRNHSRSPSPHCHFAPLPKVDQERATDAGSSTSALANMSGVGGVIPVTTSGGLRKSSLGLGVASRSRMLGSVGGTDALSEPFAIDLEDSPSAPSPRTSSPALSRNSSSSARVRRTSSAGRRSRSPSPPPGVAHHLPHHHHHYRPISPGNGSPVVGGGGGGGSSGPASRSRSPPMSRHASTDALSLHYIQGSRVVSGEICSVAPDRIAVTTPSSVLSGIGGVGAAEGVSTSRLVSSGEREKDNSTPVSSDLGRIKESVLERADGGGGGGGGRPSQTMKALPTPSSSVIGSVLRSSTPDPVGIIVTTPILTAAGAGGGAAFTGRRTSFRDAPEIVAQQHLPSPTITSSTNVIAAGGGGGGGGATAAAAAAAAAGATALALGSVAAGMGSNHTTTPQVPSNLSSHAVTMARRGSNEDVIQLDPNAGLGGEEENSGQSDERGDHHLAHGAGPDSGVILEEDEEDEDEEDNSREEDDEDEDEDEEDDEDDGEREKENDDEEEEDDEDMDEDLDRKTARGAAVEVVRWHHDEPPIHSKIVESLPAQLPTIANLS